MTDPLFGPGSSSFATTRWSVVSAAGKEQPEMARAALTTLCDIYWYPLYAFARRRGAGTTDAQDLTQGFLAELIEKGYADGAQREKGKFRSYLLTAFKGFLSREREHRNAQKRGGGQPQLSLSGVSFDPDEGERRYQIEPGHELTPERIFERRWALTVLDQVLSQLRDQFDRASKLPQFDAFKGYLTGEEATSYRDKAEALGIAEGAVKVAVHRLRKRFRDLLREEVAQTVQTPEDVDEEIQSLLEALAAR